MPNLEPELLSDVLRRAQEIQSSSQVLAQDDLEEYIVAAEEAGISREATLQALRERLGFPVHVPAPGEYVFARSADGHFYMAKLEGVSDQTATVKFLNGGTTSLPVSDLREVSFTPGQRLNYLSPSMNMWVSQPVVHFNRDTLTVTFNYWGTVENVSVDKVRLLNNTPLSIADKAQLKIGMLWTGIGGALIGFALGWFLRR